MFAFLWGAWFVSLLTVDVLAGTELRSVLVPYWGLWFLLLETIAVENDTKGDTLSENVWAFYSGHLARIPLVLGAVLFLGVRMLEAVNDVAFLIPSSVGTFDFGRTVLVVGVVLWLVPHFLLRVRFW
jgi:hypothetical protein